MKGTYMRYEQTKILVEEALAGHINIKNLCILTNKDGTVWAHFENDWPGTSEINVTDPDKIERHLLIWALSLITDHFYTRKAITRYTE